MTNCSIVISHFESLNFLRCCIRQTRKQIHPEIRQVIYIVDQSSDETHNEIVSEYGNDEDIKIVKTAPLYSGYGLDFLLRNEDIDTEYICQLHVDCFAIKNTYLKLAITLIEEYNFSFVGQLHFINYDSSIYPPNPFFSMSPTFNVAKTETYKEMSLEAGFTRFHNRPQSGLEFKNNDWTNWASSDYHARGSDDDTVAFSWYGKYKTDNMLGLAITGYIESSYGRLIEDVVFHFGSCREASTILDKMPEGYRKYTQKINEDFSDELILGMVELAKQNTPPHMEILSRNVWNGSLKKSFPSTPELDKRIEELKNN